MRLQSVFTIILCGFALCSCANKSAGPHATVQMRDGTAVSGTILSSSATEIQVAGDDKVARTIPMSQVRSVDYGDAPLPPDASTTAPVEPDPVHDRHYHPAEPAITTKTFELPAGAQISVRNEETIDSGKAVEGQTFAAEVARDVRDQTGDVVIPRGANAQIIIRSASKGGKFRGTSDLVMDLNSVSIDGRLYLLDTVYWARRGHQGVGANKRTGEFAGGGAAVGAIIGAIAGGGKGAAIGAGSGAGAGALTQILTKGGAIRVPAESVQTFRLETPLRVVAAQ